MKYIQYVIEKFSKPEFPVFKVSDVRLSLRDRKISAGYLYLMLHNLLKKNKIKRITKAIYTFHDDAAVVGFAFQPFYYGLEDALYLRGLSEQGTNFVVMSARNIRAGVRQFDGRNYRIQKLKKEYMFGYDIIKYSDFWIPVSDIEKTVIDIIYFNGGIRDELWPGILKKLDTKRLHKYLEKYTPRFKKKVLALVKEHRAQKPRV